MSPGKLDVETVRRHLAALDRAIAELRRHQGRTLEELSAHLDHRWAVERGLQLCAQNALNLATHVAAASGRDVPDYASAIDALAHMGVLEAAFAARFRAIAGFRNVLVHAYLEVDLPTVHTVLNHRLDDFVVFQDRVRAAMGSL
jgi:uncharacterized protein YutE (UPF0331/DUF86 family)